MQTVNGQRGIKIEIVLTAKEAGLVVERVVAHDKVTERTNMKNFLTWYAARLLKGGFDLHRHDHNIFGWVAVDARGDMLTIRESQKVDEETELVKGTRSSALT